MLNQRVAPSGRLIAWDYHAVAVDAQRRVWDLDTSLPLPWAGVRWLDETFALAERLPAIYAPRFRVVPAERFLAEFSSDRRHMRDRGGRYLKPPPPWPPIGQGHSLPQYLSPEVHGPGRLLGLTEMRHWLAEASAG
jgi:protein N-terminal glutamine amidohydrolase